MIKYVPHGFILGPLPLSYSLDNLNKTQNLIYFLDDNDSDSFVSCSKLGSRSKSYNANCSSNFSSYMTQMQIANSI